MGVETVFGSRKNEEFGIDPTVEAATWKWTQHAHKTPPRVSILRFEPFDSLLPTGRCLPACPLFDPEKPPWLKIAISPLPNELQLLISFLYTVSPTVWHYLHLGFLRTTC